MLEDRSWREVPTTEGENNVLTENETEPKAVRIDQFKATDLATGKRLDLPIQDLTIKITPNFDRINESLARIASGFERARVAFDQVLSASQSRGVMGALFGPEANKAFDEWAGQRPKSHIARHRLGRYKRTGRRLIEWVQWRTTEGAGL